MVILLKDYYLLTLLTPISCLSLLRRFRSFTLYPPEAGAGNRRYATEWETKDRQKLGRKDPRSLLASCRSLVRSILVHFVHRLFVSLHSPLILFTPFRGTRVRSGERWRDEVNGERHVTTVGCRFPVSVCRLTGSLCCPFFSTRVLLTSRSEGTVGNRSEERWGKGRTRPAERVE